MSTHVVPNFRLTAALDYAARGWHVVPLHWPKINAHTGAAKCSCGKADCASVGKHPLTKNGLKEASADAEQLRAWWGEWPAANVGVVTGAASGIVALDVDPDNGGDASLSALVDAYGELPGTLIVDTGGGGTHYLFAHPGRECRNTAGKLGDGLDTRGDGGYVVAAPSLHASGDRYVWRVGPADAKPAAVPGWVMALLFPPADRPKVTTREPSKDDAGRHWLGQALARARDGNRNDTGLWLACQLRDAGVGEREAEGLMLDYAERCPQGGKPYTRDEALTTLRGAYAKPPREPARNLNAAKPATPKPAPAPEPVAEAGAASELGAYLADVNEGRAYNVPWPWPMLTRLTQALIPGTVTTVCGYPGVGKTFFVLQCALHWYANGYDPAVLFVEKDRRAHMMRLLAMLETDGRFLDYDWLRQRGNRPHIDAVLARHAGIVNDVGTYTYSSGDRMTLDAAVRWFEGQAKGGRQVVVIDPITLLDAGERRWMADDAFMHRAQRVASDTGTRLVLVTHPPKGALPGKTPGGNAAGGAAYFNFCDTFLRIAKPPKPRRVRVSCDGRPGAKMTPGVFFQIEKGRHGPGSGAELAFTFTDMLYAEQGLVMEDVKEGIDPTRDEPTVPRAPRVARIQDPFEDGEERAA